MDSKNIEGTSFHWRLYLRQSIIYSNALCIQHKVPSINQLNGYVRTNYQSSPSSVLKGYIKNISFKFLRKNILTLLSRSTLGDLTISNS